MDRLPISFDIRGRRAVVVGGGEIAARKVRLLRKAGADVVIVARRLNDELAALAADGAVTVVRRSFTATDLDDGAIVFAATGEADTDRLVAAAARARRLPVNAADRPEVSTFTVPAIVDRDPVVVSVATDGTAPVLARQVRAQVERLLPAGFGRLARFAAQFRSAVRGKIADQAERRRFWEDFFTGPIAELVLHGHEVPARERMLRTINGGRTDTATGKVYIVGAGPGDPDLLTLRAFRLLQQADVIVYDRLVGPEILDHARRDADRIYVGKAKGAHTRPQAWINETLARLAGEGKTVVRLKGGDPLVFGRGGEELAYLRSRGIWTEVVPGITAATGCAAAAGIPLTQRGVASGVAFVTGHGQDGDADIDWRGLATSGQTLVVYMGVATADRTAARLMQHGLAGTTPVAVVENGSRPEQRVIAGQLLGLGSLMRRRGVTGPAVIIVGEVARAADAGLIETATPGRLVGWG